MPTTVTRRRSIATIVVVVVTLAMAATPVAAQTGADPAFVVEVHADGSAEVSVRSTLDLATDAEREAFRTLVDDGQARADATARFLDRMRAVARDAENATGREMRVTDAAIDLRRTADGETGVVTLSATWEGLAAVEGETLIVTEPFASGFAPDRPFVVIVPDGHELTQATPAPDERTADRASWGAGTDLNGFTVEFDPVDSRSGSADGDDGQVETTGQPGFGPIAVVVAVLAVAGSIRARSRHR